MRQILPCKAKLMIATAANEMNIMSAMVPISLGNDGNICPKSGAVGCHAGGDHMEFQSNGGKPVYGDVVGYGGPYFTIGYVYTGGLYGTPYIGWTVPASGSSRLDVVAFARTTTPEINEPSAKEETMRCLSASVLIYPFILSTHNINNNYYIIINNTMA